MKKSKSCIFNAKENELKVIWELTNKCSMRCLHCCNSDHRKYNDISLKKALTIVDELKKNGAKKIILGGGDPLEYDDIVPLIRYIKDLKIKLSIATSGFNLNKYYNEIVALAPLKIIIGIDGYKYETHDYFRGKRGSLRKILKNVELFHNDDIHFVFHSILNRNNKNEIINIKKYCNNHQIAYSLGTLINVKNNHHIKNMMIDEDTMNDLKNNSILEGTSFTRFPEIFLDKCYAGERIIGIRSNGLYTPCPWISNYTNRFDTPSIRNVLKFDNYREEYFLNKYCNSCNNSNCGKGCLAASLSNNMNIDPLCPNLLSVRNFNNLESEPLLEY